MSNGVRLAVVSALLMMGAGVTWPETVAAQAQTAKQAYNIPAGSLDSVLRQFSAQSRVQVIYASDVVEGKKSVGLSGSYTSAEALQQLLRNSGLELEQVNDKTIVLKRAAVPAPKAPSARTPEKRATVDANKQAIQNLEDIVVTGTYIRGMDTDGPSPVIVYDREQLDRSGASNLGDFIARLPQSVSSPSVSDIAATTNDSSRAINLRGLGDGATLVLVNGRRQQTGAVTQANASREGSVNLNVIPFSAIERVEILTDGASAIYGSDAVGGIVNVILKKKYSGLESRSRYQNTSRRDFEELSQGFVGGTTIGDLSILFSADYYKRGGVLRKDRDTSLRVLLAAPSAADAAGVPSVPANIFSTSCTSPTSCTANLPGLSSPYAAVPSGQDGTNLSIASFRETQGTLNQLLPTGALSTLYAPQERGSGYVSLNYSPNDILDLFAEGSFTKLKNRYEQPAAIRRIRVPASNAFNPFGVDVLASFYFPHSNYTKTDTDDKAATFGFDYHPEGRWRFDGYVAWTESAFQAEAYSIDPAVPASAAAIAAALARNDRATALNVFGDGLGNQPGVLSEITANSASQYGELSSLSSLAKAEVSLVDLPAGPVKGVIGAEYRDERQKYSLISRVTTPFRTSGYAPSRTIRSGFIELAVPLLKERWGVKSANLSLAGRYDDYSDFGSSFNPRIGLTIRPVDSLLLRGSYGSSFIAPSFSQSFLVQTTQQLPAVPSTVIFDPVLGVSYNLQTLVSGGNPLLTPQEADTFSAGLVYEPVWLDNLKLSLDWYRIKYDDKITTLIFRELPPLEPLFPQNFVRSSTPLPGESVGRIVQIRQGPVNVSSVRTSGMDVNLSYWLDTSIGQFDASLSATRVFHYKTRLTPITPSIDRLGTAGNPKAWESGASLLYSRGNFSVGPSVRYTHSYTTLGADGISVVQLPSTTIWALNASYEYFPSSGSPWFKSTRLGVGVDNLFNKMPSFTATGLGFDLSEADLRGRQYYLTMNVQF